MKKYVLLFLLFSQGVCADIFKCQDESGVTAFQSKPCAKGDEQYLIRAKRNYLAAQTIDDLKEGEATILFDDVMEGNEDAMAVYGRILKKLPDNYFSPDYKTPLELKRIEEDRYRNSDIGRLQRSIDEQNDLLREQAARDQYKALTKDISSRHEKSSQQRQERHLKKIIRQQQEFDSSAREERQKQKVRRGWDESEQKRRDRDLQYRLDEIEFKMMIH